MRSSDRFGQVTSIPSICCNFCLPCSSGPTVDGIKSGLYEPIEFKFGITALGQELVEERGLDPATEQLLEMVHESVRDGLLELLNRGMPVPEVGYELQDSDAEIIADGELAWVADQLVVLVSAQDIWRKGFEDNGWTVISEDMEGSWVDAVRAILMERINA